MILTYLGILVAALAVVGVFQYIALQSFLRGELAGSLRTEARYALQSSGPPGAALDNPDGLVRSASSPAVRAALYDTSLNRLALSPPGPRAAAWAVPDLALLAGKAGQRAPAPYQVMGSSTGDVLGVAVSVGPKGSPVGFLVLEGSLAPLDSTLLGDLIIFCVAAFLSLLLAGTVTALFTTRVLRRLERVSEAAGAVAAGDLNRRASVTGTDELATLGTAFDHMVDRLQREIVRQQESEDAMRRFLADASHELRTPLTALRGNLDLLRRGAFTDTGDLATALSDMHQTVVRMSRLVQDLLTLTRLEHGSDLVLTPIEVEPVLHEVARAGQLAHDRTITVEVSGKLRVVSDSDALHRVFLNLIDNAAKYSPDDTPIQLRAHTDGQRVAIDVVDQGVGIPTEEQALIFQRFYRRDKMRSPRSTGVGLGLSICQALVGHLGGSIAVRSESGNGCTFIISLPAAHHANQVAG